MTGIFNYNEFIRILKHGREDDEEVMLKPSAGCNSKLVSS